MASTKTIPALGSLSPVQFWLTVTCVLESTLTMRTGPDPLHEAVTVDGATSMPTCSPVVFDIESITALPLVRLQLLLVRVPMPVMAEPSGPPSSQRSCMRCAYLMPAANIDPWNS